MKGAVLYADDHLGVFNKPPGVSLATPRSEPGLAAQRLLASLPEGELDSLGLAGERFLLVHRLDVGTSGLVLLARDEETHRMLSAQLSARSIEKTYLALVWGHPRPPAGVYESPIGPDKRDRRRMKASPDGRAAITRYRTLARASHVALLELHPETGRTHQIRVHLSHAGHWIVGDDLYGGARHRGIKDERLRALLSPPHLLLHAWRLELARPLGSGVSRFEAPLPDAFRAAIEALGLDRALPAEWGKID